MEEIMLKKNSLTCILFLSLLLLSANSIMSQDKAISYDGVMYSLSSGENNLKITNTTDDPDAEVAIVPFKMKLDNGVASGETIGVIQVYFTYPADNLDMTYEVNTDIWQDDPDHFTFNDADGIVTISFNGGTVDPSIFYNTWQTLITFQFTAGCQESNQHFVIDFPSYTPTEPLRNAVITSMGNQFVPDDDMYELLGGAIYLYYYPNYKFDQVEVNGALGTEVTVDVYIDNDFYVDGVKHAIVYNTNYLEFLGIEDYSDAFPGGFVGDPPAQGDSPIFVELATGSGYDIPPGDDYQHIYTLRFYCKYDYALWDGSVANIGINQGYDFYTRVGYNGTGYCEDASTGMYFYSLNGNITINPYEAELTAEVSDGLLFKEATGAQDFTVTTFIKNNFNIGGAVPGQTLSDDSRLRVDFAFTDDFGANVTDIYRPNLSNPNNNNTLDHFWFEMHTGTAKSLPYNIEFYSVSKTELMNTLPINPDSVALLQFDIELNGGWSEPTSYTDRYLPLPFACDFEGDPARVIDNITELRSVECNTGLTFNTGSGFEYAVGSIITSRGYSVKPNSVYQSVYVKGNFDIEEFYAKVTKDGYHHIVGIVTEPGVDVVGNGSDYVEFASSTDWDATVIDAPIKIATIEYNLIYSQVDIQDTDPLPEPLRVNPGETRWCYKYTYTSISEDSYVGLADGREAFMFNAADWVRTAYDCSPVVIDPNPGDPSLDPLKLDGLPTEFKLHTNYPNPFNPATTIAYDLPKGAEVTLEIYNILGQKVETLFEGYLEAGRYTVSWDASKYSSGIYLSRLVTSEFQATQKMILMK